MVPPSVRGENPLTDGRSRNNEPTDILEGSGSRTVECCQKKGESTLDFIKRWRELIRNNPLAQQDAITICRRGLLTVISEKLLGANIRSFDQLNSIVAEIEVFLANNIAHTSLKSKLLKERNTVGKGVNIVDFSPTNEEKGVAISVTLKKKSELKTPMPTLANCMKTPYSFKEEHTKKLFDLYLNNKLIVLAEPKK
ncbi:hypothetical protein Taro_032151 [Colocasia esculenta]|uniref:Uncharacterized protein n=1 Tax=Colocasia esculenta TaxID=4460 RepID=A0A843W5B2_COLES|nr:hypothetical protein [Colocasia esculenta]